MGLHDYICNDCVAFAKKELDVEDLTEEQESMLVFETKYGFTATSKELKIATQCPFCDGNNTKKIITGPACVRFRGGHNWEEFRRENNSSMRRDMAIHQLKTADPYASMRQAGEVDDLAHRLKASGLKSNQVKKKHFIVKPD